MKTRIIALLAFAFLAKTLSGQQIFPVALTGFLIPPHSLDLSVYATQRAQDLVFNAVLNDPLEPFRDTRLKLYIENNGNVIYVTDPNYAFPTLRLDKQVPVNLDGFALQPYLQPQALTGATGQGQGSVIVPQGLNRICIEVIDIQRNAPISRKACVTGSFVLNEPPQLLMPICHNQMPFPPTQSQLFNWTPLHFGSANNPAPVEYVFKLVELLPGADPNDGFDFNFQVLEKTSMTPSLIYSPVDPPLYPGKTYAWRVQARNMIKPGLLFRNNGFSQVCTFTYYGNGGSGGPFGNGNDPFGGGGFPGGGGGFPGGGGGGGIGGSTGAEQQEEIRVPPQGCEVFNTDFGAIFSDNYTPAPLVEGDVVGIGYFDMTVSDATASGEGYSGTGYVLIPLLKTKVQVEFTDLKAKPNTLRCYEAEEIRAVGENQFYINPNNLSQATLGTNFNQQYFQNLDNFFTNGQGTTRKVSQFDPANPTPNLLPIGIDKEDSPLIAVTGIRFTPRNCYLTCAGYSKTSGGQIMRYAGFNLQITPYGVKNGSELTMLDVNGSTSEVADIFTLKITGGTGGSGMSMYCDGFRGYDLDAEISVDPQVMVTAGDSPASGGAGGGGTVKIGLSESSSDPATYLGGIDDFSDFTLPAMPGFTFKVNGGQLDLSGSEKINLQTFPNYYQTAQSTEWRGLYLGDVQVKLPAEYDFSGQGNQLTLDKGSLFVAGQGAFGSFQKNNLVSLETGKLGEWRYSVDTMRLRISGSQTDSTLLSGRIRVPLLDVPFAYRSNLNVSSNFTEMKVNPTPGVRGMSMWGGEINLEESTQVTAQLKEVNGQRKFFPSAKLNGKLKIDLDATEFNDKLTGNKAQTIAQLKQLLGIAGEPDFKLDDLRLGGFSVDPYAVPGQRYLLESWGNGGDSVSIGGKKFKIGEVSVLAAMDTTGSGRQELGLKIIALDRSSLVEFVLWGRASEQGGFTFNRIEVKTENITCNCTSMLNRGGFDPSILGMIKERYYEKHYSPAALGFKPLDEKTGSLASEGGAFDKKSIVQKFAAGDLDSYKTAVMDYLDERLVGGFIVENGVLQLPWGDEISLDLPPADLKLPWKDLISVNQTGETYRAEIKINRSDANFTIAGIDTHKSSSENKKLPLDLTSKLQSLGIKGTYPFPANTEVRLLLTKFEVTQNTGGTAIGAGANVAAEFTLLVKVSDGGQDEHLQFTNNTADRLSATGLGLRDFYLYLDADGKYPGDGFDLTFKKSDGTQPTSNTYTKIDCDGFRDFNVQAELALPKEKVRTLKPAPDTGDEALTVGVSITGNNLQNFYGAVKANKPGIAGQPLNFVVPGAEAVVFSLPATFTAYLDMNSQENKDDFPANYSGANGFRGLVFKDLQFNPVGFNKKTGSAEAPLVVPCQDFIITPDGVEGKVAKTQVVEQASNSLLGGWPYQLDAISFEFKASRFVGDDPGIKLSGKMRLPVIKGDAAWLTYAGKLTFNTAGGKYEPAAEFAFKEEELSQAFDFEGLEGFRVRFEDGSRIGLRYVSGNAPGFVSYASLTGSAGIFMGPFNYDLISFQGFEINPVAENNAGLMRSTGRVGAIRTVNSGAWGTKPPSSNAGDMNPPGQNPARGLQGFPIVISEFKMAGKPGGELGFEFGTGVNLMPGGGSSPPPGTRLTQPSGRAANQLAQQSSVSGRIGKTCGLSAKTTIAVNFLLKDGSFTNNFPEGSPTQKVDYEGFKVEGRFGPVKIVGEMSNIEEDAASENAFKAKLKVEGGGMPVDKGLAQFGKTKGTATVRDGYRHFFIDLEVPGETGIAPVKIALHGGGASSYYNMRADTTKMNDSGASQTGATAKLRVSFLPVANATGQAATKEKKGRAKQEGKGTATPSAPAFSNVAQRKTATQSSTARSSTAAARAVDGSTRKGSQTTNETGAWVTIDLGASHVIDAITLFNARNSRQNNRVEKYYVMISDQPFPATNPTDTSDPKFMDVNAALAMSVWKTPLRNDNGKSNWTIDVSSGETPTPVSPTVAGRYVRVQLANDYGNQLNLTEIRVMGRPAN